MHSVTLTVSNTTTIDNSPIGAAQIRAVALCALVTLIEGIDLTLIPVLAPRFRDAWAVSSETFGIILALGPVGLIMGGLGIGWLGDRIGRRNALIAAMLLMTVATFATTLCTNVPQLLSARLVSGIAFGGVIPAAIALVSESLPLRVRGNVVAFVFMGQAGGGVLAAVLVKLPMMAGPWQTPVLWVAGGCAVVTALLVMALPESPRYLEKSGPPNRWRDLFTDGRATGTALLWATFIGICFAVSFFTNSLTVTYSHTGKPSDVGVDATGIYSIGAMIGGQLLPLFARRWPGTQVLLVSIMAAVGSCVVIGLALPASYAMNMAAAALCGVFVSGAFFMLYPPTVQFYPTYIRSTGIGAAVAFGRFGNIASPLVAGYMLGAGMSPSSVFYVVAMPMVLSCVALVAFIRHTRAP
jgi:MFS family permease